MAPLIDHPCVWRGEELLARDDWLQELSAGEVDALGHQAGGATIVLPDELKTRLRSIQHNLEHGSGACLLRGVPVDAYSPDQAKALFAEIAAHVGSAVSQSAAGEKVFSVRDEGFALDDTRARGPNTRKRLSFHTDRCDVIAFLCLQPAMSGGDNQVVSSAALYNALAAQRPDVVATLSEPFYYRRHNVDQGNPRPWCQQPIFSFCDGHFAASYLRVLIDRAYAMPELPDMSPAQHEALDALEQLAGDPAMHVTFRQDRGDMLFLNNWVTLHRRDEFVDHEDIARRRHILRIWLAVPNSRPLDARFADNFGDTRAGALRGGMPAAEDQANRD